MPDQQLLFERDVLMPTAQLLLALHTSKKARL